MKTDKKLSEDILIQKQSFILDSTKQNRNRILFFLIFILYALLSVLGTTDRDFFFENGINFPLLNIKLPLIAFYMVVPIIIILVQFNVLFLYKEHQQLLKKHIIFKNFYKSIPLGIFDMPIFENKKLYKLMQIFIFIIIYITPLLTLYIFWWHFNKYQNSFYSFLHLFYILADTLMLGYFLYKNQKGKVIFYIFFFTYIVTFFLQLAIIYEQKMLSFIKVNPNFIEKYYPHLELSGEHLVNFDYAQLKTLQSLNPKKKLAFLQPPLNLSNRSFKYANFSGTLLIRINLSNVNLKKANLWGTQLQGANLRKANLKGANLNGVQLQGANLESANFQGSNLYYANLMGTNLIYADFRNSDLEHAKLSGAILLLAQLQGVDLIHTEFQGANLMDALLQGANLYAANLIGANLSRARLQGANLSYAKLHGAYFTNARLEGVHSCNTEDDLESYGFVKRINSYINKKTDLNCIDKKPINKKEKDKLLQIIQDLQNIKNLYVDEEVKIDIEHHISYIKNHSSTPFLGKAKIGSYTKEQAHMWIIWNEKTVDK